MTIHPPYETFHSLAKHGNLVPIFQEIQADLDTPVSAFMKVAGNSPYAFLLESVHGGEKWGRYSLIGLDPLAWFRIQGQQAEIQYPNQPPEIVATANPIAALQTFLNSFQPVITSDRLPRFHGGAVGFFGYDIVGCFERLPNRHPNLLEIPDALWMFPAMVLVFDNLLGKLTVVANTFLPTNFDPLTLYQNAQNSISKIIHTLRHGSPSFPDLPTPRDPPGGFQDEMGREIFEDAVSRAKEYIAAGDIMQVVLSHRMSVDFPYPAISLYRAIRATNPSPYLFLLQMGDFSLVGSSPEILVRQEGNTATVRPIAGTRHRGIDTREDLALESELLADPKEIAEHIMLVDLGRNDLGRVCQIGSVRVTERMVIERYSHVMHIVSNVEGQLLPGKNAFDLIAATFPAGTVSGAPKIRAMEIIDELEVGRRGPYAGAVGYISYSGHMDLAITIRTALIKNHRLYVQAGAGIVADSQPAKEYEETINKAKAILKAIELVRQGLE